MELLGGQDSPEYSLPD